MCSKATAQFLETDSAFPAMNEIFEGYIDFSKIKGTDSVIVTGKTGARELIVRYKNGRLDNISYIDTLTSKAVAWKYFSYSVKNQIERIGFKECIGIDDRVKRIKIDCASIKTFYTRDFLYDSNGHVKDEIFLWYNRQVLGDSVVKKYRKVKHGLIIESTGKSPRKIEVKFDDSGRLKSKKELNSSGDIFYFSEVGYKNKYKAIIVLKMFRDTMDDTPFPEREFKFEITFDSKNHPKVFTNGKAEYHFRYY